MKPDDYYSMEGYLDKRCRQFLKDKQEMRIYKIIYVVLFWYIGIMSCYIQKKERKKLIRF